MVFWLDDCALRPIAAVRQNEILSQLDVMDLIFAGGDAKSLRARLKTHLNRSLRDGDDAVLTPDDARRFWSEARPTRYRHYRDVVIHREPRLRSLAAERARIGRELINGLYAPRGADLAGQAFFAGVAADSMVERALRSIKAR